MRTLDSSSLFAAREAHAAPQRRFDSVLIANRGEIAVRIIHALKRLGLRSIAVYSDADRGALHTQIADEAIHLGPTALSESYLNPEALIRAAIDSGAQAIHPGYGFLSENADFAEEVRRHGLIFIGPSTHAITVMGDKISAKEHVREAGVPVLPGLTKHALSDAQLIEVATQMGFPLLIKPSAGGGGKGMEEVYRAQELPEKIASARRVARNAFADDTLFLERLLTRPRHVEIQILGDESGRIIHVGERECTLQRRHQKVIEEAPSPLSDQALRDKMGEAAIIAARSVGYTGAGTVEFLVSSEHPEDFYFMEMNTRLQVEHPVTELVSGLDLVEAQVRVAQGEQITYDGDGVELHGHAIEARIYAENPEANFLPATGRVVEFIPPAGPGIRVDSALLEGQDISGDYDPMLAKVISYGQDRREALDRLETALSQTVIFGVPTNIDFLRRLLRDPQVQEAELDTGLIERKMDTLTHQEVPPEALHAALAALETSLVQQPSPRWGAAWRTDGFRWAEKTGKVWVFDHHGHEYRVDSQQRGQLAARLEDQTGDHQSVENQALGRQGLDKQSLGQFGTHTLLREQPGGEREIWVHTPNFLDEITVPSRQALIQASVDVAQKKNNEGDSLPSPEVRSPMPGTVVSISRQEFIETDQVVAVVEAMKMEHPLRASSPGRLKLFVAVGDVVKAGQVLARVDVDEGQHPESQPDSLPERTEK